MGLQYMIIMKKLSILVSLCLLAFAAAAQNPLDAYRLSQSDLRGTARFMSMGGAFGALGADLSTLSQNPGGIGVYRSSEVGFSIGLDCQNISTDYMGFKQSESQTKFYLDNIGIVGTLKLRNKTLMNLNIGFTYNKRASFSGRFSGGIPQLKTSLSNYIAGIANNYELTESDVKSTGSYDPYNPGVGDRYVPWAPIIAYDSYLINPEEHNGRTTWQGQFGNGTSGFGNYAMQESGSIDEYNIALGGNISNKVFWGMNFQIVDVNYTVSSLWQENLKNAYVYNPNFGKTGIQDARWGMNNLYNVNGNGFTYELGVIVKPIQELRLGLAFHTPTYYNLTENYYPDRVAYTYNFKHNPELGRDNTDGNDYAVTNDNVSTYNNTKLETPWRVIASVAGVIANKCIISFDYEWAGFKNMKFKEANDYYYDDYWDYGYDDYFMNTRADDYAYQSATAAANECISTIYRNSSTFRIGAEYRVLPNFSVRAGYSYSTSPVTKEARLNLDNIPSTGTFTGYRLDNQTQYVTAGIGYHYKGFYVDAAYVYKYMSSGYTPFAADPADVANTAMNAQVSFNTSKVVLSAGFKF